MERFSISLRSTSHQLEQYCIERKIPYLLVVARGPVHGENPDWFSMPPEDYVRHAKQIDKFINIGKIAVLLPGMRQVLPTLIANDIIGVQPMSGPVGQIFTMRTRYGSDRPKTLRGYWDRRRYYYNTLRRKLKWYLTAPGWYLRLWYQNAQRRRNGDEANLSGDDRFLDDLRRNRVR
jgi:hypothetical protein